MSDRKYSIAMTLAMASALATTWLAHFTRPASGTMQKEWLIQAMERVESNPAHPNERGDDGTAWGPLQVRRVMLDDANRIGHTSLTLSDMEDRAKAEQACLTVLRHYDAEVLRETGRVASDKELCFVWNGGGSAWRRVEHPLSDKTQVMLERYWAKVQAAR